MDQIIQGDCLEVLQELPAESVHCVVTSPPYWGLRDYGVAGQLGLETTIKEYITRLMQVFTEVRRVLRSDGTLWLNLGDSYAGSWGAQGRKDSVAMYSPVSAALIEHHPDRGHNTGSLARTPGLKPKDLMGMPWRVAFALQDAGWYLRSDIIWHKPNPMPESVTDRPTKAHEYLFLMAKSERYYYDAGAVSEHAINGRDLGLLRGRSFTDAKHVAWHADSIRSRQLAGVDSYSAGTGYRNKRSVWTVATHPFPEAHFATFPPALIEPCILAGCPTGGIVLDPFGGSGTVGVVARLHSRHYILIELNPTYCVMAERRILRESRQPVLWSIAGKDAS